VRINKYKRDIGREKVTESEPLKDGKRGKG